MNRRLIQNLTYRSSCFLFIVIRKKLCSNTLDVLFYVNSCIKLRYRQKVLVPAVSKYLIAYNVGVHMYRMFAEDRGWHKNGCLWEMYVYCNFGGCLAHRG